VFIVFVDVLLPVVLVAAVGGAVAHRAGMRVEPLASLTFTLFTPALIFDSLSRVSTNGATVARIVAVIVIGFAVAAAASLAWSRLAGQDRPTLAAAALCAAVANLGNMGLPVARLAFGEVGLEVAVVAFVASSVLTYSAGVFLASMASGSARAALSAPLRAPALWAAVAALVVQASDVAVPHAVETATSTLAGAAIPAMLVVLGLQVREHLHRIDDVRVAVVPLGLRLFASPALAAAIAASVGLGGVAARTLILLGGMPTAVNTTIIATRYRARPALVTQVVVASTLISVITLTVLTTLLR
jgi:predicted permease